MKCFDHVWTNDFSTKEGFKFWTRFNLHVWNPKARITFKKSESTYHFQDFPQMCSMNSLASAKKVSKIQKREPIKIWSGFFNRFIWHERTNCLNLKLHRKDFLQDFTCRILLDKSPLKGEGQEIQQKLKKFWFENLFGDGSRSTLK